MGHFQIYQEDNLMADNKISSSAKLKGTLLMLAANLLWGSSFVVTKGASDAFPTYMLVAIRMFLGGASVAIIYWKQLKETTREVLLCGVLLGAIYAASLMLQTFGIKYTSAGRSSFLTASYCIFMPFMEWLILKNKPELKNIVAAILGIIGIGLVALNESFRVDSGDLLTLMSSIGFAVNIILLSVFVKRMDPGLLNAYLLMFGGIMLFVISLFTETLPAQVSPSVTFSLLYLGIACSGIPLLFQSIAQKSISPTLVTILLGTQAIIASILSAIMYKEAFSTRCLIGFVVILVSIIIGEIDLKKKA